MNRHVPVDLRQCHAAQVRIHFKKLKQTKRINHFSYKIEVKDNDPHLWKVKQMKTFSEQLPDFFIFKLAAVISLSTFVFLSVVYMGLSYTKPNGVVTKGFSVFPRQVITTSEESHRNMEAVIALKVQALGLSSFSFFHYYVSHRPGTSICISGVQTLYTFSYSVLNK